jgi:thiamine-monophosphate kinase
MDEFDVIVRLMRPLVTSAEALGLADDAALLSARPGHQLAVTKDMLQADVHFRANDPAEAIAQKALRVNLSDLAAMGAEPYGYFLALGLPDGVSEGWLQSFCQGLAADQQAYGIALMGGDTTRTTGPLSLSITALGWVPEGQALTRRGARVGDHLYVSGTLGDGALGLRDLASPAHARYLRPEPRLKLGVALRGVASAAMDISDGLVQDAGHFATASDVRLVIEAERVPLSDAVRHAIVQERFSLADALTGGDDYELLFTAPANTCLPANELITCIGRVEAGEGVQVVDATGAAMVLARAGYRHHF